MVKRPLIGVTGFFLAGILAFIFGVNLQIVLIFAIALTALVFFFGGKYKTLFLIMILALLVGVLRMYMAQGHRAEVLRRFESKEALLTMTVTEFGSKGKAVTEFSDGTKTYKMYLSVKSGCELSPGDVVKASVTLYEPYTSKVSISDFSTYLSGRGVYLYGYASDAEIVGRSKSGVMGMVYSVRRYLDKIGKNAFSGDNRALFNAMVFGDKRLISPKLSEALRAAGLNHIAVVSGMHLSIMISVVMMLMGRFFGRQRKGKIILVAGAVFLTLITGAGASVVRACIMCILCQMALFSYRENDAVSTLALTVLVMTVFNPWIIFNIGFILSVLSVLGIVLFSSPLKEWISKFSGDTVGEAVSVCISAQLTVTPALIIFFGALSPYSVLANLAVSNFANMLVICGMLFAVTAQIPVISEITKSFIKLFAEAIARVCDFTKNLPGAILNVKWLGIGFAVLWAFTVTVVCFKRKNKVLAKRITAIFTAFVLIFAVYRACDNPKVRMTFAPYGEKEMTSIFLPDGRAILLECPDYSDAINLLDSHRIKSYTYTVLAEKDLWDVKKLSANGAAGTVVAYADNFKSEEKQKIEQELKPFGTEVVFLKDGESFYAKDMSVRFIVRNFAVIPEIEYKGRTFVSLQGIDANEMQELVCSKMYFNCDYLKLPPHILYEENSCEFLTAGQILKDEKEFTINLY